MRILPRTARPKDTNSTYLILLCIKLITELKQNFMRRVEEIFSCKKEAYEIQIQSLYTIPEILSSMTLFNEIQLIPYNLYTTHVCFWLSSLASIQFMTMKCSVLDYSLPSSFSCPTIFLSNSR
jgi:hypothetical protein